MAALVVQSRFAGLKIEDDDYPASEVQKVKKPKPATVKKPEPPKKAKNNNTKSQVPKSIKRYVDSYIFCIFANFSPIVMGIRW